MGPLDLLRAFTPGMVPQSPRNPWVAAANPPPFWPSDPAAYDWSDIAGAMPLPDRSDGSGSPGAMLMIDRPDLSVDDVRAQLLAGAASRIRPTDFPLNPDNWAPTLQNPVSSSPFSPGGIAAPDPASDFGLAAYPVPLVNFPLGPTGPDRPGASLYGTGWPLVSSDAQRNSFIQVASNGGIKTDDEDPNYQIRKELGEESPDEDLEHGRGPPPLQAPLPLPVPQLRALPPPNLADHHLFPRQFAPFFTSRGIGIDDHTITLGQTTHQKGVHGKGLGEMPGGWNQRWNEFIKENPNATAADIFQQAGKMMDEYGLNDLPIHPYGEPPP